MNTINNNDPIMNENIRAKQVRIVGPTGKQGGVIDTVTALRLADSEALDLVIVDSNSNPPVARLMDYKKVQYQLNKNKKKAEHKAAEAAKIKELRLGLNIEDHDMQTLLKHAERFLQSGNKVRITLNLRGRQQDRPESGFAVINKFVSMVEHGTAVEPKQSGRIIFTTISPVKHKNS